MRHYTTSKKERSFIQISIILCLYSEIMYVDNSFDPLSNIGFQFFKRYHYLFWSSEIQLHAEKKTTLCV